MFIFFGGVEKLTSDLQLICLLNENKRRVYQFDEADLHTVQFGKRGRESFSLDYSFRMWVIKANFHLNMFNEMELPNHLIMCSLYIVA